MESHIRPIIFKNKQYNSASEALQAYISEYDGRKNYMKRHKYDAQFNELFSINRKPSRPQTPLEILVNNSLAQNSANTNSLKKPASRNNSLLHKSHTLNNSTLQKSVASTNSLLQKSVSASEELLRRIEADRLPSPPKELFPTGKPGGTIEANQLTKEGFPTGRPSLGSVADTDVLLSAPPYPVINTNVNPRPETDDSLSTNSSIITGHLLQGNITNHLKGKHLARKLASTPKRELKSSREKARFEPEGRAGAGNRTPSNLSPVRVGFEKSSPSKNATANNNLDSSFGGKENIPGILKGSSLMNSNGNYRKTNSHVSFTTDDLLLQNSNALNVTTPKSSPKSKVELQFKNPPGSGNLSNESSPKLKRETKSTTWKDSPKQVPVEPRYKQFLQELMNEIDDSASTGSNLITERVNGASLGIGTLGNELPDSTDCGFLQRIQNLLLTTQAAAPLSQDSNHDGESVNSSVSIEEPEFLRRSKLECEKIMLDYKSSLAGDCSTAAATDETTTQPPGSLEALKNLLFTVQSLSATNDTGDLDEDSSATTSKPDPTIPGDNDDVINDDASLNDTLTSLMSLETKQLLSSDQTHLAETMKHLSQLKSLLEKKN